MVFEGIKLIKRKYIILNLALRVINLLMSGWYISLIQTRNNRQRSAADQAGSNLILVGKHKPIRQRLLETYERILFCVRWPQTPDAVRIKIADPESPGSRISKGPCAQSLGLRLMSPSAPE
jgi:hypothetical protein